MNGHDWAEWRKRLGYDVQSLMLELGVNSRQTINNWENSEEVPRMAELALYGLEHYPACRRVIGERVQKAEGRRYFAKRRGERVG